MRWDINNYIIFETTAGSHAYGTSTLESDIDIRGVCIPPLNVLLGLENFDQKDKWEDKDDRVIYGLKRFLMLCKDANPNIIELLFIPTEFWIRDDPVWNLILENKELFVSKKLRYTFGGYAYSQLERIKRHRSWLLDPPKKKPTRSDYHLPGKSVFNLEQRSAILSLPKEIIVPELRDAAERERAYTQSKKYWDQYIQWKTNRNPARAKLEEKFGFDCKHASHLVRLFYEGKEALITGHITLPLPQAEEILAIKEGKYTYDQLMDLISNYDEIFDRLYDESPLPENPNVKSIMKLYETILWDRFSLPQSKEK